MRCLDRFAACLILDGSARSRSFLSAIDRSGFDLPIDNTTTIIGAWISELELVSSKFGWEALPVRIVVDEITPLPQSFVPPVSLTINGEVDPYAWRGSGGVLRDITQRYRKDQFVLVIAGVQVPLEPLGEVLERMANFDADVVILAEEDGSSVGISLIRCGCLRDISPIGFVDFKEQALTRISQKNIVRILNVPARSFMPIRSRESYIAALRAWSEKNRCLVAGDACSERYEPLFSIVERGAIVAEASEILDSVILAGATVDQGACIVESVVCPGQRVGPGQEIIQSLVGNEDTAMI